MDGGMCERMDGGINGGMDSGGMKVLMEEWVDVWMK